MGQMSNILYGSPMVWVGLTNDYPSSKKNSFVLYVYVLTYISFPYEILVLQNKEKTIFWNYKEIKNTKFDK